MQWLGTHQIAPDTSVLVDVPVLASWIGTSVRRGGGDKGVGWLLSQAPVQELLEAKHGPNGLLLRLTMRGWERFQRIKAGKSTGRNAFMAMKFDDADMSAVFAACFKPAVESVGFVLKTLMDDQPAGLIDDQLRVALRNSQFVIADLTHANNGAYWEAGFAEGLGRPVIYTCREAEWKSQRTHFDTNHLVTIIWNQDDYASAMHRLAATIRATLPDGATPPRQ